MNIKDSGDQIYEEVETSEEGYKGCVYGERYPGRERRECISYHTKGTCVIWCGKIPFFHLVVRPVGLIVTVIWGGSEVWRLQSRRWWPYTLWYNK